MFSYPSVGSYPEWGLLIAAGVATYEVFRKFARENEAQLDEEVRDLMGQWDNINKSIVENQSNPDIKFQKMLQVERLRIRDDCYTCARRLTDRAKGINRILFPSRHRYLLRRFDQIMGYANAGCDVWGQPMFLPIMKYFGIDECRIGLNERLNAVTMETLRLGAVLHGIALSMSETGAPYQTPNGSSDIMQ